MLLGKKDEKYDLLIMLLKEVCETVLLQLKIQQNFGKYEIIIYNVHVVMHGMQLHLILFNGNVNYDLKVLKLKKTVRLLHITIGEFWFDIKERKRKKNKTITPATATARTTTKKFEKMASIITPQHNVRQVHIIEVLLMIKLMVLREKGEKYDLFMVVMINLFEIVLLQHKPQHNLIKYEIIIYKVYAAMHVHQLNLVLFEGNINYILKVSKEKKIVQSLHIITLEFWFDIKKRKKKEKKKKKEKQEH